MEVQFDLDFEKGTLLKKSLALLERFVSFNSQSKNIHGVNLAQRFVGEFLKERGLVVEYIENPKKLSADMLIAHINPYRDLPIINLICHSDTVLPPFQECSFRISDDGIRAYGSGIADDKAGVIICMQIMEYLFQIRNEIPFHIRLLCSPNEEVGSLGWHDFYQECGLESYINLGFEPSLPNGDIISSRNGNRWYKLKLKGKAAHAGRFGESSINASHELARIIVELHHLNDYVSKVKVNVGSIEGGTGHYNIICGEASAKIDMRFPCFESRERLHQKFLSITERSEYACFYTGELSKSSWELEDDCPPMPYHPQNSDLIKKYIEQIHDVEGRWIDSQHTGGAADINYLSSETNINIDGLGAIGAGLHTREEFIEIDSLYTRTVALTQLILNLSIQKNMEFHEEISFGGDIL